MSALSRLYQHMFWADQRAITALRSMPDVPPQAVDLLSHLLAAEHVWLRRIQHSAATYDVWPKLTLDECDRLAHANHVAFTTIIESADVGALAGLVKYKNTGGKPFETSLEDILLHVSHHGMYHRGQIALLVRASGGTPLPTDYVFFTRGD